jgi:6-pyruvoyltetrahydropterin/6-carboxytetrahydropterin synthase
MIIAKDYKFESAHFLPMVPSTHTCNQLHGHNYLVRIIIEGPVRDDGMVVDFFEIDEAMKLPLAKVDHRVLNDISGLENPTAENIACWFFRKINHIGESRVLKSVRVYETDSCYAEYTP